MSRDFPTLGNEAKKKEGKNLYMTDGRLEAYALVPKGLKGRGGLVWRR